MTSDKWRWWACQLYATAAFKHQKIPLLFNSVTGWVEPRF